MFRPLRTLQKAFNCGNIRLCFILRFNFYCFILIFRQRIHRNGFTETNLGLHELIVEHTDRGPNMRDLDTSSSEQEQQIKNVSTLYVEIPRMYNFFFSKKKLQFFPGFWYF